jgi:hypothetical protein
MTASICRPPLASTILLAASSLLTCQDAAEGLPSTDA